MFPEKIQLTDDLIDLITNQRKENHISAYDLSEKIGKNKSWLTNIENHRTKTISRKDLLALFSQFNIPVDLDPELFIIKNLPPTAQIQTSDGMTQYCLELQTKYNLLPTNSSTKYLNNLTLLKDQETFKYALNRFSECMMDNFTQTRDNRDSIYFTLKNIVYTTNIDYTLANSFFNIDIFNEYPEDEYSQFADNYRKELQALIEFTSKQFKLLSIKTKVYGYFSEGGNRYNLMQELIAAEYAPVNELIDILKDIEDYIHSVYKYVSLSFEYAPDSFVDYKKLYSVAERLLKTFVAITHTNYSFSYNVPSNDSSKEEINEAQLQLNNIFFEIKTAFIKKTNADPTSYE